VRFEHRTADGHSDMVLAIAIANWAATREFYQAQIGTYSL
jgi:hypothetical protein